MTLELAITGPTDEPFSLFVAAMLHPANEKRRSTCLQPDGLLESLCDPPLPKSNGRPIPGGEIALGFFLVICGDHAEKHVKAAVDRILAAYFWHFHLLVIKRQTNQRVVLFRSQQNFDYFSRATEESIHYE